MIRNGAVVLPDRILPVGEYAVLVDGDHIEAIQKCNRKSDFATDTVIDARDGWILPGFVDVHCHGGGGFDFMDGTAEAFLQIQAIHVRHGTTAIAPTAVACSLAELGHLFRICREVLTTDHQGADLIGLHLEGPYLSIAMKGAQPESEIRLPDITETRQILDAGQGIICRWSAAPELPGSKSFAEQVRQAGICLSVAHSEATCPDIQQAFDWGFHSITHLYSSTTSVRKINQIVQAGIVEAAYLLDDMIVELIGDGKHVPKELMQMVHKLKGPDKVILVSDAMRAAGTAVLESHLGKIKPENRVIIEEGVAKLPDRSFYAGSIATGDLMLRNAVQHNKLPLPDAVRMMTLTPARLVGIDRRKGSLEPGKDADIVIMDRNLKVHTVLVRGRTVFDAPCA